MILKPITEENYFQVSQIYKEGISTGIATFESEVPSWAKWNTDHLSRGRIAAFDGENMLGWASLASVSSRAVYAGVAEVSVYIGEESRGQGVGNFLLKELIKISEEHGFWTLQSAIDSENESSIRLHQKCNFRVIGFKEKIAQMKSGQWKDTTLMERRSKIIGV